MDKPCIKISDMKDTVLLQKNPCVTGLSWPIHPYFTEEEVELVCDKIKEIEILVSI